MNSHFTSTAKAKSLPLLCQQRLDDERQLFASDYQKYYLEGETKAQHIGEPYLLHNPGSTRGVLLIHGLMAAPEEVREWADFLFSKGFTVYAPRMAGHGTSADDLAQRKRGEWIESVNRGHEILKMCCDRITVAGFSTGGAIALHQAISKPNTFEALISISAPLKFKTFSAHFARPVNLWNSALRTFDSLMPSIVNTALLRKEFATNHADNPHINYLRCPVSSIAEIQRLMKGVEKNIATLSIPTLIIHGTHDPKVDVESARELFKKLPDGEKYYKEIDFHLHGIIRGYIAQTVFREVDNFLNSPRQTTKRGFNRET
ncbi:alpha/beta hydrolase [Alkalimarinus alittae]|uniref:Alpha/beta fold hydrolase n=1 Tax=Alkalimarinus alittae TaxID=2961619 RepID=A0ABY6N3S4_9ALTE|nr:alpha/beta fold hydrolase [Alkalimarinus alittae]UZE96660.1 alpha/beta fold hydrolase [Alkalimarinus alittae]